MHAALLEGVLQRLEGAALPGGYVVKVFVPQGMVLMLFTSRDSASRSCRAISDFAHSRHAAPSEIANWGGCAGSRCQPATGRSKASR